MTSAVDNLLPVPAASVPAVVDTSKPPVLCPALVTVIVYAFVEFGATVVGPLKVTVVAGPPLWHEEQVAPLRVAGFPE
jgi:hypothetical protein